MAQYLNKSLNTIRFETPDVEIPKISDRNDSEDDDIASSCRSPLASTNAIDINAARNASTNFEFFTRQIPESNHPVPMALDEKLGEYDSSGETASIPTIASPPHKKPNRKSIYEMSDTDDEDNEDSSNSVNARTLSEDENELPVTSKDKDMRISSLFIDKDYSNGDIDLRLPFKPVMANYIPATEIDASITSHAPITYSVIYQFYCCNSRPPSIDLLIAIDGGHE